MNNYRVSGTSKKGGHVNWTFDVSAMNALDAKAVSLDEWNSSRPDVHLFQVQVRRVPELSECQNMWVRHKIIY